MSNETITQTNNADEKIHYRDRDLIGFKKQLVHVHKISNVCYRVGKKRESNHIKTGKVCCI